MGLIGHPMNSLEQPAEQPSEQLRYARLLSWGSHAGLIVLVLSFVAYVTGVLAPFVPMDRLPELWSHPVARYLQETGMPTGWGWAMLLRQGDMLGLLGIAILAGCSVLGLLVVVPLYAARGAHALAAVCLVEAAVVLLAASGWLGGGR